MKTKRNLSGIYFRHQNENGKWENRCFEDLPDDKQEEILATRDKEWLISMVTNLCDTINRIGDKLDLMSD